MFRRIAAPCPVRPSARALIDAASPVCPLASRMPSTARPPRVKLLNSAVRSSPPGASVLAVNSICPLVVTESSLDSAAAPVVEAQQEAAAARRRGHHRAGEDPGEERVAHRGTPCRRGHRLAPDVGQNAERVAPAGRARTASAAPAATAWMARTSGATGSERVLSSQAVKINGTMATAIHR